MLLSEADQSRVIEMAWEDRTSFDAIQHLYGLSEGAVICLMRQSLKASSFRLWRARVTGRKTKHVAKQQTDIRSSHAAGQYKVDHGRKPRP
jgi:uncharacterized protein (TIGR03643 family)